MMTINTHKDCENLVKMLEDFTKRSKAISNVEVSYYSEFARIDVRVTKATGKVYKEMIEALNNILPYMYSNKNKYPCDWWYSYDNTVINPYIEGKWEVELCVRYW